MPRRLLPSGRKSVLTHSRCIHIMANSTGVRKRRNSLRTEGPTNRSVHQLGDTGNTGNRWRTTVHSTHNPRIPEIMGSTPQDYISVQPTCQSASGDRSEEHEKNTHRQCGTWYETQRKESGSGTNGIQTNTHKGDRQDTGKDDAGKRAQRPHTGQGHPRPGTVSNTRNIPAKVGRQGESLCSKIHERKRQMGRTHETANTAQRGRPGILPEHAWSGHRQVDDNGDNPQS